MSALMLAKGILGVAVLFLIYLVLSFVIPKLSSFRVSPKNRQDKEFTSSSMGQAGRGQFK